jgi:preprotein translocase subunit SecG
MWELLALSWLHYAFSIPLSLLSVFLMLVILVQRGRGGGLTGALGGMGGQSAFGTKAGDLFTRITIGVAAIWILLSMLTLKVLNNPTPIAARPPANVTTPDTKQGDANATAPAGGTTTPGTDAGAGAVSPAPDGKAGSPDSGGPSSADAKSAESKADEATGAAAPAPVNAAPATAAPADDSKKVNP